MAATPPHQITFAPDTPSTPRHGPSYDDSPNTRSSARLRQKRALDATNHTDHPRGRLTQSAKTPSSPRESLHKSHTSLQSPGPTPKRKSAPRVQIHSPTSPNTQFTEPLSSSLAPTRLRPYDSTTTTMGEGMLPTPVKTPKKKQISKSNLAGRALFQDGTTISEMAQSPRKARKTRRYNGFSLESFRADENANEGQIQIFTDSRDQVPEEDGTKDNPFVQPKQSAARSERVAGTAKRRKVSERRARDPQVEEAIQNDEGMVYVFRGKKVFRRFDDTGEEEEEIDPDDLGLLEHSITGSGSRRRFKTLTRKSIKPTRLFQTEEQKRIREAEREEEATTDIDDTIPGKHNGTSFSTDPDVVSDAKPSSSASVDKVGTNDGSLCKKASPFDSWPRSKSSAGKQARGQKRAHVEDQDDRVHT